MLTAPNRWRRRGAGWGHATSDASRNEVAKGQAGQDQQFMRNATTDVPEASTSASKRPRRPIETVDPPRR